MHGHVKTLEGAKWNGCILGVKNIFYIHENQKYIFLRFPQGFW